MDIVTLRKSTWLRIAAMALVYFVTARLALKFAVVGDALFWPPSGIALAALLLFGRRLWPGILCGALLVNLVAGLPLSAATGIALGNTLAALLGAFLLRRKTGFNHHLHSQQDVLRLLIYGSVVSTMVSAANGAFWLTWPEGTIYGDFFSRTFLFWWMGDALGVVLFTQAVIAFHRRDTLQWTPKLQRMALLMFCTLILLCAKHQQRHTLQFGCPLQRIPAEESNHSLRK